jgi:hypothetical protein
VGVEVVETAAVEGTPRTVAERNPRTVAAAAALVKEATEAAG